MHSTNVLFYLILWSNLSMILCIEITNFTLSDGDVFAIRLGRADHFSINLLTPSAVAFHFWAKEDYIVKTFTTSGIASNADWARPEAYCQTGRMKLDSDGFKKLYLSSKGQQYKITDENGFECVVNSWHANSKVTVFQLGSPSGLDLEPIEVFRCCGVETTTSATTTVS